MRGCVGLISIFVFVECTHSEVVAARILGGASSGGSGRLCWGGLPVTHLWMSCVALCVQILKNLFFISKRLYAHHLDHGADEQAAMASAGPVADGEAKGSGLVWTFKQLGYLARMETTQRPHVRWRRRCPVCLVVLHWRLCCHAFAHHHPNPAVCCYIMSRRASER